MTYIEELEQEANEWVEFKEHVAAAVEHLEACLAISDACSDREGVARKSPEDVPALVAARRLYEAADQRAVDACERLCNAY